MPPGQDRLEGIAFGESFCVVDGDVSPDDDAEQHTCEPSDDTGDEDSHSEPASTRIEEGTKVYRHGGFHPVYIGDVYNGKYEIMSKLGYGMYSTVWLVKDLSFPEKCHKELSDPSRKKYYALKVLSAECYGTERPIFEREILKHLRTEDRDHPGYKYICHLQDDFEIEGPNGTHVCLVFELMGETLESFPCWFVDELVPEPVMRKFTTQMLLGLDYAHDCHIIHTDIKPSNIFVKFGDTSLIESEYLKEIEIPVQDKSSNKYTVVRSMPLLNHYFNDNDNVMNLDVVLGDWGLASWSYHRLSDRIQPAAFRSPEIIIGAPWDERTDWWNLGAVIIEVFRGVCMFSARPDGRYNPKEHLREIMGIFGPLNKSLLAKGDPELVSQWFNADGFMDDRAEPPYNFFDYLRRDGLDGAKWTDFMLFIQVLMALDPDDRVPTQDLLELPWPDAYGKWGSRDSDDGGEGNDPSDEAGQPASAWFLECVRGAWDSVSGWLGTLVFRWRL